MKRPRPCFGCGGVGPLFTTKAAIEPRLASGELKLVLEDWATMGPGFYVYYPSRRQVPNGLRLLTELIREMLPLGFEDDILRNRQGAADDASTYGKSSILLVGWTSSHELRHRV